MKANNPTHILTEHAGFSRQIWHLAWMDVQKAQRGALLGWLWVIVRPLLMLGFYWFIIAIGLHSNSIAGEGYAYLPWLVVGLCSWFFISDMINAGVGAFRKYKFLVTKTKFPVATIPTIVLISNFMVHAILLGLVMVYLYMAGYFALEWLQLPIYAFLALALMWAWSLLAAPLGVISKDFSQLVKSLMRVLVWISGILWSIQNVHIHWLRDIMQLNPIYFIAEGYRKSLIYHQWFFEDLRGFLIFLSELVLLMTLAVVVYKRSRKELADTL
jgi:teichoic acid transport system permease protein